MPSSRGSSQPRDRTRVSLCFLHLQAGSLPLAPPGKLGKSLSESESVSRSVVSDCLESMDCSPESPRWDFLGKNTGVGCHFLLQGIFPTQGSNPCLPHCRQTLYHLEPPEMLYSTVFIVRYNIYVDPGSPGPL